MIGRTSTSFARGQAAWRGALLWGIGGPFYLQGDCPPKHTKCQGAWKSVLTDLPPSLHCFPPGIYPLQNTCIRKVKVLKAPKFDLTKLMEVHGDYTEELGAKLERPVAAAVVEGAAEAE